MLYRSNVDYPITMAAARALARQTLRGGYFRTDAQTGWVHCPRCGKRDHRLEVVGVMGRMPTTKDTVDQIAWAIRDCAYDNQTTTERTI